MTSLTHPQPLHEGKACSFSEYLDLRDDGFQYELVQGVLSGHSGIYAQLH